MMAEDPHKTRTIARVLAIVVSALFAALAVAGYRRTDDLTQLVVFLALSALAYFSVIWVFKGIDWLLDKVDDRHSGQ